MIDSLIDIISGVLGDSSDAIDSIDTGSCSESGIDSYDDSSNAINSDGGTSDALDNSIIDGIDGSVSNVISGDCEVDDLLNNGIDTESTNVTGDAHSADVNNKHKGRFISFVGATCCNLCNSCGHYQGGDSMDSICTCGHAKKLHRWG